MDARAASARARYRPAVAAQWPQTQPDPGLHARLVQRVCMYGGSRERVCVPGGRPEQIFGVRHCVGVPAVMRPVILGPQRVLRRGVSKS